MDVSKYIVTFEFLGNNNYYSTIVSESFNVFKGNPTISIGVINATYGQIAKVIIQCNAEGNVTISIGSIKTYDNVLIRNNIIIQDIADIEVGTYSVNVIYHGNKNYNAMACDTKLTINKIPTTTLATVDNIIYSEKAIINVKTSVDGIVVVKIDETYINYVNIIANTVTSVIFDNIPAGKHNILVTLTPSNKNYIESSFSTDFTVSKKSTSVDLAVADVIYGKDTIVNVTTSESGKITLTVGDIVSERSILANKLLQINLGLLNSGTYDVNVIFSAGDNYKNSNALDNFVIYPSKSNINIIEASNVIYGEDTIIKVKTNVSGVVSVKIGDITKNIDVVANKFSVFNFGILNANSYDVEVTLDAGKNYIKTTNRTQIIVSPKSTEIKLLTKNINVGDMLTVTANVNALEGFVTFKLDSQSKTVKIVNNKATFTINSLSEGSYTIVAIYNDNNGNYLSSSNSVLVKVSKNSPTLSVIAEDIYENQDALFEITVNNDAIGKISVLINNKTYENTLSNGKTLIRVSNLAVGNYLFTVYYGGDEKYYSKSIVDNISVKELNIILNAHDLIKYYGASDKLSAQLLDKSNKPLSGQKIIFTVNGAEYKRTTNNDGIASMNINLISGNHTANVKFEGNGIYDAIKKTVQIQIKQTVYGNNIAKIYKNGTQYYAKFVDIKGNLLANTPVTFNINGVFYTRTTNENGVAKLNINLNPGEYIITATNPNSNEMYSNVVTVLSNIAENHDLTKYYKNASQYVIRLLDDRGKPVGAGVSVEFNINGVFYTRTSNATGHVKMNVNLNPGTYIITANYKGLMTSNTITVKPILQAKDLSMRYKDGSKFEVKLLDGQGKAFAGQKITFNINGVFYDRTTDVNGVARLNINLMAGQYIITSMYSNGAVISNKVTISS